MTVAMDGLIEVDERGVARVAGTRVKVMHVARDGGGEATPGELSRRFPHLSLAQVHAALSYYHAHRAAVDAEAAENDRVAEQMRAAAGTRVL